MFVCCTTYTCGRVLLLMHRRARRSAIIRGNGSQIRRNRSAGVQIFEFIKLLGQQGSGDSLLPSVRQIPSKGAPPSSPPQLASDSQQQQQQSVSVDRLVAECMNEFEDDAAAPAATVPVFTTAAGSGATDNATTLQQQQQQQQQAPAKQMRVFGRRETGGRTPVAKVASLSPCLLLSRGGLMCAILFNM